MKRIKDYFRPPDFVAQLTPTPVASSPLAMEWHDTSGSVTIIQSSGHIVDEISISAKIGLFTQNMRLVAGKHGFPLRSHIEDPRTLGHYTDAFIKITGWRDEHPLRIAVREALEKERASK